MSASRDRNGYEARGAKARPRVAYFIYSSKVGAGGGHFYSLREITDGLREVVDHQILNLGASFAPPLQGFSRVTYIPLFKYNAFRRLFDVVRYLRKHRPEVIHAFDTKSLFVARMARFFYRCPIVFTKCGGVNGSRNIADADCQILFSQENFDFYKQFGNPDIPKYLIPNRVNSIVPDPQRIAELRKQYGLEDRYVLLRISRFNPYYRKTFRQSVALLKQKLEQRPDAVLLLVGKIQSEPFFEEFRSEIAGLPVVVVTDERYTTNASALLDIADVVVATGRGVMEACSFDKEVYCPVQDSELPVRLNDQTFDILSAMNFSERAPYVDAGDAPFEGTKRYFDAHFSVAAVSELYGEIYRNIRESRFRPLNFVKHAIQFFKPNPDNR